MDGFRPDKSVSDVLACAVRRHDPQKKLCPGSESNQPHVDFQGRLMGIWQRNQASTYLRS